MSRIRSLLWVMILGVGLLVASAGSAQAHSYYHGFHHHHHHHKHRVGFSISIGSPFRHYGFSSFSYYSPSWYGYRSYPSYSWSYPSYASYPVYVPTYSSYSVGVPVERRASYYYYDTPPASRSQPAPEAAVAGRNHVRLEVVLPDPNAEVWVEGQKTTTTGRVRTFESPELQPNRSYTYNLRASWMQDGRPVTQDRQVQVVTGRSTTVDFTQPPGPERVPPPGGGNGRP